MKNTDIIKDKLNILDVVGSYVKLDKAGKTYKGKSPFTNEKTPSFFVSPEKGFFYCFSSQKGGDMFTFIQEIERVDFKDALKILAEKAGVNLDDIPLENNDTKSLWYKILDDACKWYEVQLRKTPAVVEYLLSRGLTKETIIKFRIGYVPEGWHHLYSYLKSKKYSDEDMEQVGLVTKKEQGSYYDRFRSRIMFPLRDAQGRIVGFSGRIFSNDEAEVKGAKYVNSPEGPLFDKSSILFGYSFAKHEIRNKDACLLVEGQFDVILSHQAGYVNTVAISGTGLSDQHLGLIKRFSNNLLLALDSDSAGIKATRRSVLSAYRNGMNVRVVSLPKGMDPADTIAKSKEQFGVYVHDAKDYFDYRIEEASGEELSFKEKKVLVEQDLFTFVYLNQSAMVQDRMLQKIALFLGVSIEAVREDFARYIPESDSRADEAVPKESSKESSVSPKVQINSQEYILHLFLFVQEQGYTYDETIYQKIKDLYIDRYQSSLEDDLHNLEETQKNIQLFVFQEQYKDANESFLKNAVIRSLLEERIRQINQLSLELLSKIRQAEAQSNEAELQKLTQENNNLKMLKSTLLEQFEN